VPIYKLTDENIFPHPSLAEPDGLLAIGGDLSPERLLLAYTNGIFPWYDKDEPLLWWTPDPRCVLFPPKFLPSKSLRSLINKKLFEIKFDTAFKKVIEFCANVNRKGQNGTWITPEMIEAYTHLHELGFAHSVESFYQGQLVGGLYGVAIGKAFFGESMFYAVSNASKVAFFYLIEKLRQWKFEIIDIQITSEHLINMGAEEISRDEFLSILNESVYKKGHREKWT
jgi:leucyl/phenylalanyl-tRNA---protein transferase